MPRGSPTGRASRLEGPIVCPGTLSERGISRPPFAERSPSLPPRPSRLDDRLAGLEARVLLRSTGKPCESGHELGGISLYTFCVTIKVKIRYNKKDLFGSEADAL